MSGRRGRPPGTKNQPGSKRPGPKPKVTIASSSSNGTPCPSPTQPEDGMSHKRQKTNEAPLPTSGHGSSGQSKGKQLMAARPLAPMFVRASAATRNAAIDPGSSTREGKAMRFLFLTILVGIMDETAVVHDSEGVEAAIDLPDADFESLRSSEDPANQETVEIAAPNLPEHIDSHSFTVTVPIRDNDEETSEGYSSGEEEIVMASDDEEEEEEREEHEDAGNIFSGERQKSSHRGGAMNKSESVETYLADLEDDIKKQVKG
ncbi:hypothetical protein HDU96_004303, partial [Phlyctochytrium bullatum]